VSRGYDHDVATLTARKVSRFLGNVELDAPIWRQVVLGHLEVNGILFIDKGIHALAARDIHCKRGRWITPEGSHFIITCAEMHGDPPPPHWSTKVWQEVAGVGPGRSARAGRVRRQLQRMVLRR
jgi:hypothetical protein